jgi:hypothetical protein
MVMDLDVMAESAAPTRVPSPTAEVTGKEGVDVNDESASAVTANSGEQERNASEVARPEVESPRRMGNLMKELKQDVQQGGMEFNMDNFF